MSEEGAVKQKVLFPQKGFKQQHWKQIREKLLTDEDWYKEGATIWIRPSGVQRLVIAEEEPRLAQQFVELRVIAVAPNKRKVICKREGYDKKIDCLIPRRMKGEFLIGKPIKAEKLDTPDGRELYRHEYLAVQ